MTTRNQISKIIYSVPVLLLVIPLVAMQFTTEVNWTSSDFAIGGAILFTTAFCIDIVLRKVKTFKSRLILVLITLAILILVWAEMAVGIFGSPIAGN